jgi:adenylylsulfate kinase
MTPAFGLWITGLPASGKSSITRALVDELASRGVRVVVLESDVLRQVLTPQPTYSDAERQTFYRAMVYIGSLLVSHGVPVIFDATANRRAYRAAAREAIDHFMEIYVDTPLAVCMARDPKGIYARAVSGEASTVPGAQASYEPPDRPELVVSSVDSRDAARAIVRALESRRFLAPPEPVVTR